MVYGQFEPCHILELVQRNIDQGFYAQELLEKYSETEWDELNSHLKHERDESMTYAAMEQWRGKYLVQNRVTNEIKETPQMAYMLISATLFAEYPRETRLQWVKDYYDAVALFICPLPLWLALELNDFLCVQLRVMTVWIALMLLLVAF